MSDLERRIVQFHHTGDEHLVSEDNASFGELDTEKIPAFGKCLGMMDNIGENFKEREYTKLFIQPTKLFTQLLVPLALRKIS